MGLHHIAYLLARPGEYVTVAELLAARDRPAPCDAGPRLDARAKGAYRRRLDDLRSELAEAERVHDRGREEAVRAEMEFIRHEIADAVGLGGRDRPAGSAAERARLTVTKRIKDAVARVRRQHPALGETSAAPSAPGSSACTCRPRFSWTLGHLTPSARSVRRPLRPHDGREGRANTWDTTGSASSAPAARASPR